MKKENYKNPKIFSFKHRECDILEYARKWLSGNIVIEDIEGTLDGEYGKKMKNSLLQVNNSDEFWEWLNTNFEF